MDSCVVTCAFREPYITHHLRQKELLSCDVIPFVDCLPYKEGIVTENVVSRFQQSLYGFKPHAIKFALDMGIKKIVWLDPSVFPQFPIDLIFDLLEEHPVIVRPGENNVKEMSSDTSIEYFGLRGVDLSDTKHVAGTIYGFNFNNPDAINVFNDWIKAEEDGIFGTQDDFMRGHWADEACLALCLKKNNVKSFWSDKIVYLNQKNL